MSETIETVDAEEIEQARQLAADAQRIVVKAGTNSLTDEDSQLDRVKLDKLVSDIMDLRRRGKAGVFGRDRRGNGATG
mgnify:CR=1 FL=1